MYKESVQYLYTKENSRIWREVCEHFRRVCYPLKNSSRNSECVNETYNKFHIGLDQDLSTTFNIEYRLRNMYIFFHCSTAPGGPGPLIVEALRSHSDTSHS
jgi:hypothetical protein